MVSNSLSRRRHVIASPAICKPPWPPPPPPPYGVTCTCGVTGSYNTVTKIITGGKYPWLDSLPDLDPVKTWMHSDPEFEWLNPYADQNHRAETWGNFLVPPGTTSVEITAGFVFSNGHKCSAHRIVATPGA